MTLARALNDPRADLVKNRDGTHNEGLESTSAVVPRHKIPSNSPPMVSDEPQDNVATKNDMNFRFVVQDRPVVSTLGIEAWRSKCPEMLESGRVAFQGLYPRSKRGVVVLTIRHRPRLL